MDEPEAGTEQLTTPIHELDHVRLIADRGRWPAGTTGTLVEALDGIALVEISDDQGRTLEIIDVPYPLIKPSGD